MKEKNLKKLFFTSGFFSGLGIVCFIAKIIELTMRTEHEWAKICTILGFVFLGIALVLLCITVLVGSKYEKLNNNKKPVSNEEILEKYKSKRK